MSYCASLICWEQADATLCTKCQKLKAQYEAYDLELEIPGVEEKAFQAQGFLDLAAFEAEVNHHHPQEAHHLLDAWDSVVQVFGKGRCKTTGRFQRWAGSGFVVERPARQVTCAGRTLNLNTKVHRVVVTNWHVYNEELADEVQLWAKFTDGTVVPLDLSPDSVRRHHAGADGHDYVAFDLVPTDDQVAKLRKVHALPWEESHRVYTLPAGTPVVILGHPRGASTRGSFGKITSEFKAGERATAHFYYSPDLSRPGSSGSPVFFLYHPADLKGAFVCAIHYRSGEGVAYVGAIAESVRQQLNAEAAEVSEAELAKLQARFVVE